MTIQTDMQVTTQDPSRWRKFQAWLAVVTEAMDYDPHLQTQATIEHLESRISVLETTLTNPDQ